MIGCDEDVVTTTTISNYAYTLFDADSTFYATAFTETFGVCGTFTYTAQLSNGTELPSDIFTFDSTALSFTVEPSAISVSIIYDVQLIGTLPSPGVSTTLNFFVTLTGC